MIWIFGDSYVDSGFPNSEFVIPWYNRFGKTKNFAICGTGQPYAFNMFYEVEHLIKKTDKIIFVLSEDYRLNWPDVELFAQCEILRNGYHEEYTGTRNRDLHDYVFKMSDKKMTLKNILFLKNLKIKTITFSVDPFFEFDETTNLFHHFPLPLPKLLEGDFTMNHLCPHNHDVMEEYFDDFISNKLKTLDEYNFHYEPESKKWTKKGFIYE